MRVAIEILTKYSLQAIIKCTSGLAAAILDLLRPATSDSIDSFDGKFNKLSDFENIGVAVGMKPR